MPYGISQKVEHQGSPLLIFLNLIFPPECLTVSPSSKSLMSWVLRRGHLSGTGYNPSWTAGSLFDAGR